MAGSTGRSANIIVGAAAFYLSAEDSLSEGWPSATVPAGVDGVSITQALNNSADWVNVGYTTDGVEYSYEPDYGEVEVDQLLDAAKMFKQKQTAMVKTSFVEATLTQLNIVMDQSANDYEGLPGSGTYKANAVNGFADTTGFDGVTLNAGDEHQGLSGGALGVEPIERQAVFVGPSPRSLTNKRRERIYHLRRVLSVESSTHGLKRNEATVFPVSFRLLPGAVSGAQYGTIRDRVITSS